MYIALIANLQYLKNILLQNTSTNLPLLSSTAHENHFFLFSSPSPSPSPLLSFFSASSAQLGSLAQMATVRPRGHFISRQSRHTVWRLGPAPHLVAHWYGDLDSNSHIAAHSRPSSQLGSPRGEGSTVFLHPKFQTSGEGSLPSSTLWPARSIGTPTTRLLSPVLRVAAPDACQIGDPLPQSTQSIHSTRT